jgi:hypothetical protein
VGEKPSRPSTVEYVRGDFRLLVPPAPCLESSGTTDVPLLRECLLWVVVLFLLVVLFFKA